MKKYLMPIALAAILMILMYHIASGLSVMEAMDMKQTMPAMPMQMK